MSNLITNMRDFWLRWNGRDFEMQEILDMTSDLAMVVELLEKRITELEAQSK